MPKLRVENLKKIKNCTSFISLRLLLELFWLLVTSSPLQHIKLGKLMNDFVKA